MSDTPAYIGLFPWMAQWWIDHLDTKPIVLIRCGHREDNDSGAKAEGVECRNAIGEVKSDGDVLLAMSRNQHPEIETDWTPLAAPTEEELAAELADRHAQVLRYLGTGPGPGSIVYKRTALPREVAPIKHLTFYVCRMHGTVEVDCADLEAFAAEALRTAPTVTRTYCPRHDVD